MRTSNWAAQSNIIMGFILNNMSTRQGLLGLSQLSLVFDFSNVRLEQINFPKKKKKTLSLLFYFIGERGIEPRTSDT